MARDINRELAALGFRDIGVIERPGLAVPVSYTHLDVYKRHIVECSILVKNGLQPVFTDYSPFLFLP